MGRCPRPHQRGQEVVCRADIWFENGGTWISVNYGCFEGALIHRRVVERMAFPISVFSYKAMTNLWLSRCTSHQCNIHQ